MDDGLEVTAGGTGNGRITITSEDVESAFVLVRVYQVAKSLTLSPDSASLAVGETATLRAAVMDANGNDIRLAEGLKGGLVVYWETSDSDVATVVGADHHPRQEHGRHRDGYRGRGRYGHDHGAPRWRRDRHGDDNGDGQQLIGSRPTGLCGRPCWTRRR